MASSASHRRACGRCGKTKVGAAYRNPKAPWCRACETACETAAEVRIHIHATAAAEAFAAATLARTLRQPAARGR